MRTVGIALGHDARDGQDGVQADEVIQRDRSGRHAKLHGRGVDRVHGNTFQQQLERLAQVREEHASDQETGAIAHDDRSFPQPSGQIHERGHCLVVGLLAPDHLDQLHPLRRMKEMHAGEPLGMDP